MAVQALKTKAPTQYERPLTIKRIIEDDIRPADDEYPKLKELDERMHMLKFSSKIAKQYSGAENPDGTKTEKLNRFQNILDYY